MTVVFDVGANIGQTARGLVRYFDSAKLFCFEPASKPFRVLQAKYGSRPNVLCVNAALGSEVGTRELHVGAESELNTFVVGSPRRDCLTQTEAVAVDTVDRFCATHDLPKIDILKMDVQGWECEVLRGAAQMIGKNNVHFVVSEVGFFRHDVDMVQIFRSP